MASQLATLEAIASTIHRQTALRGASDDPETADLAPDTHLTTVLIRQVKDLVDNHVTVPVTPSSVDISAAIEITRLARVADSVSRWSCCLKKYFEKTTAASIRADLVSTLVLNEARSIATTNQALDLAQAAGTAAMNAFGRRLVRPGDTEEIERWKQIAIRDYERVHGRKVNVVGQLGLSPALERRCFLNMRVLQLLELQDWLSSTATSPQILINLPIVPLHRQCQRKKLQEKSGDNCGICLEEFCEKDADRVPSAVVSLPLCGHCFHKLCITEWLQQNNSCPMCRRKFISVEECLEWADKVNRRRERRRRRKVRLHASRESIVRSGVE
ncbi:hypothetical protein B0T21DRAFT_345642 [Apiosordaria backusii]|uniref:RING-type domain-containing protein n=1 Tax=Apiosordaria backusii TaxID=314023 RepID=A0AA40EM14_9PEZI|nr:hypothetical protein B0T21DRAFT_345642 [Apiosordaria backusii]